MQPQEEAKMIVDNVHLIAKILERLEHGPLKAGALATSVGVKKGKPLNQLLYAMKKKGLVERNDEGASPAIWQLTPPI